MTAIAQAATIIGTIERIVVLPVEVCFRCRDDRSRRTYIGGVKPSLP
jgi:hypothetical protein